MYVRKGAYMHTYQGQQLTRTKTHMLEEEDTRLQSSRTTTHTHKDAHARGGGYMPTVIKDSNSHAQRHTYPFTHKDSTAHTCKHTLKNERDEGEDTCLQSQSFSFGPSVSTNFAFSCSHTHSLPHAPRLRLGHRWRLRGFFFLTPILKSQCLFLPNTRRRRDFSYPQILKSRCRSTSTL